MTYRFPWCFAVTVIALLSHSIDPSEVMCQYRCQQWGEKAVCVYECVVHVCVYVYECTLYMYVVCVCMSVRCTCVCLCVCVWNLQSLMYMYMCTCTCTCVCVCVCVYVHVYMCVEFMIYMYMYMYTIVTVHCLVCKPWTLRHHGVSLTTLSPWFQVP